LPKKDQVLSFFAEPAASSKRIKLRFLRLRHKFGCVVAAIKGSMSCNRTTRQQFGVAVSTVIRWVQRETGSVAHGVLLGGCDDIADNFFALNCIFFFPFNRIIEY
jgi:hypothetical protein